MKITDITRSILEDAETDVKYYGMADAFVKAITEYFYDTDGEYRGIKGLTELEIPNGENAGTYYMMEPRDLAILRKHPDIRIAFGLKNANSKGGMLRMPNPEKYGFKYLVLFHCINPVFMHDEDGQRKIGSFIVNNFALHHTIRHELVHVFDARRMTTKNTKHYQQDSFPSREKEKKSYYNDEMEFNAYFHNLSDLLLSIISSMKEHPKDAVDYADLYGFNPDFNTMLKTYLSSTSAGTSMFVKSLKPARRKRLLSRIYKLHQHAVAILQQAQRPSI